MDREREEALTLGLLEAIEEREDVTQRHLADRLGVALGLANSYLRRCVRKGYVKIRQAPANRYLYYLTPRGLAEKSRLTAEFFSASFDFYRRASRSYSTLLRRVARRGDRRLLLVGASELAEVAFLRARELGLEVVGVYDPGCRKRSFVGVPVFREPPPAGSWDAAILTTLSGAAGVHRRATEALQRAQAEDGVSAGRRAPGQPRGPSRGRGAARTPMEVPDVLLPLVSANGPRGIHSATGAPVAPREEDS